VGCPNRAVFAKNIIDSCNKPFSKKISCEGHCLYLLSSQGERADKKADEEAFDLFGRPLEGRVDPAERKRKVRIYIYINIYR